MAGIWRTKRAPAGLLDRAKTCFLYAARSRLRYMKPRLPTPWRG